MRVLKKIHNPYPTAQIQNTQKISLRREDECERSSLKSVGKGSGRPRLGQIKNATFSFNLEFEAEDF
jgi:hypothetical protein